MHDLGNYPSNMSSWIATYLLLNPRIQVEKGRVMATNSPIVVFILAWISNELGLKT